MAFDPNDICKSLNMGNPKDNELEITRTTIGEPYACDRGDNNDITLNLSHNQLDGTLPEILSMNSTTLNGLSDVSAGT